MADLGQLKITNVHAVDVRNVPFSEGLVPPWNPSQRITSRDYLVIRVESNQGFYGLSMDGDYSPHLPASARDVKRLIAPYLVGKQVMDMEAHSAFLHSVRPQGRFFFVAVALWDLVGKATGLPLYRLWGGKRDKVRVYASTVHHGRSPTARAEDCLRYLDQGYRAVKLRLSAETIREDIALVETCRRAVGDRMAIMVDANQAGKTPGADGPGVCWDLIRAQETARLLADLDVAYLEEPLSYQLGREGSILRKASETPVAGGEGKRGIQAFSALLQEGIYDILQPDPITGGTPSDMLKVQAMAEGAGVPIVYHHGKSGVGFMIGLHLCTAFGNSPWLEYMDDGRFWQPRGFQVGFRDVVPVDDGGYVHCPEAPGLGIDWDPDWLRQIGLGS
jgi:L-alanine-DL-glutamate epimerase-like enolase superfamily enzyme